MSQIGTPDGAAGHRNGLPDGGGRRPRARTLVAAALVCALAFLFLAGGGWPLWKDRVDRDGAGFVSFGSSHLRTEQYAIVGDLRGDGPSWLYGSTVFGDERVRATSQRSGSLFVGIGRKVDVLQYLRDVGYATVESFEVSADTTHEGGAPSGPPSEQAFWAKSTEGAGRRTLRWVPRDGHWSVVLMNSDAGPTVDVRGDASAELPLLPWLAAGFLTVGAITALVGARFLRAVRGDRRTPEPPAGAHQEPAHGITVGPQH